MAGWMGVEELPIQFLRIRSMECECRAYASLPRRVCTVGVVSLSEGFRGHELHLMGRRRRHRIIHITRTLSSTNVLVSTNLSFCNLLASRISARRRNDEYRDHIVSRGYV